MAMALLVLGGVTLLAAATPQIAFPFDSQIPPVARIGAPFSFTFTTNTFRPDGANLLYTIGGEPAWLQFDAVNRTLWGVPGAADAVTTKFTITGSDGGGSTAMLCTLVVSANTAPSSKIDMSAALSRAGNLTGPTSLLAHPSQKLEVTFGPSSYDGHGKSLSFYATLADYTPLPSWLTFDSKAVSFSGTPPILSSSPESFDIRLIASDIPNFAGAWDEFTIVVSNRTWAFDPQEQTVDVPSGGSVNVDDSRSFLTTGNGAAITSDLQRADAQIPAWLTFDPQTLALTGTPPPGTTETDVNITAFDNYGNAATLTLHLRFGGLLKNSIEPLKVKVGQNLEYKVNTSDFVEPGVQVKFDLSKAGSWLHFDPGQLKLSGTVPDSLAGQTINLNMTLTSADGARTDATVVKLQVEPKTGNTNGHSSTRTISSVTSAASSSSSAAKVTSEIGRSSGRDKGIIAAVIVGPVLAITAAILLVLYCRARRQNKKDSKPPSKADISRPMPNEEDGYDDEDLKEIGAGPPMEQTIAPQVALDLSPSKPGTRLSMLPPAKRALLRISQNPQSHASSVLEEGEAKTLEDFSRSPWGYGTSGTPSARPHESMKIPAAIARASGQPRHVSSNRSDRLSSPLGPKNRKSGGYQRLPGRGHGRNSNICSSCGSVDCLTGSGHGRASTSGCQCSYYADHALPLQPHEEVSESSYGTPTTSMVSTAPSAFPIPPTWQSNSASRMPKLSHTVPTIRSSKAKKGGAGSSEVSDVPSELPDRRSMLEKRQSYIRHRAANRSPFFASSGSTRSRTESSSMSNTLAKPTTAPTSGGKEAADAVQASPKRPGSKKLLVREYSASSSLDPSFDPANRGRSRSRFKWALAEGFPRALSRARSSIASGLRFEDASDADWERRSISVYTAEGGREDEDDGAVTDAIAGADRTPSPSPSRRQPLEPPAVHTPHTRPMTDPPKGPLPTLPAPAPIPPKSPRRSIGAALAGNKRRNQQQQQQPRPMSGTAGTDDEVGEYPPDEEAPTPDVALAVRQMRASQLPQRPGSNVSQRRQQQQVQRQSDAGEGSSSAAAATAASPSLHGATRKKARAKKVYPDLKRGNIMERPRSSFRPASATTAGKVARRRPASTGDGNTRPRARGSVKGKGKAKAVEDEENVLGNEAFL